MAEVGEPPLKIVRRSEEENPIFTNPQWNRILSFLTLPDLQNLSQSHSKLKKIVETFVGEGQKVVIDRDTLWFLPLATHSVLYAHYGRICTNLEINGVFDDEMEILFNQFQSLRELTLRNIYVAPSEKEPTLWPKDLVKLTLIRNNIWRDILYSWMVGLHSLVSLYLQSNMWMMLPKLLSLEMLTTIDQRLYTKDFVLPRLKKWTMDKLHDDLNAFSNSPQLEHLRIIHPVDSKNKHRIEALNLKTTEVFYWQVPEEEGDTPILKLNEYCLLHLQKYLPSKDWMSFRLTHEDFYKLRIPQFVISLVPPFEYLKLFAHLVSRRLEVRMKTLKSEGIREILPLFTNLTELDLSVMCHEAADVIPSGIRKLSFFARNTGDLSALFARLSPTLRVLVIKGPQDQIKGLEQLANVQEFLWESFRVTEQSLQFLRVNRSCLRKLVLQLRNTDLERDLWTLISQMENLEILSVNCDEFEINIPQIPRGSSLPKLKKLILEDRDVELSEFYTSMHGALLEYLNVSEFTPEILRFTNLKQLRLFLCKENVLLSLVAGLPNLVDLSVEMDEWLITIPTRNAIHKHLKQTNRKMRINELHLG